jgi:hypothetical protein
MILALRCTTGAPPQLRKLFRNGAAVCDGIRGADEKQEAERGEVRVFLSLLHLIWLFPLF